MNSNGLSINSTCHIKKHGSRTMSNHDFTFLTECSNDSHQILIIKFAGMLCKLWDGITTGKDHRIKLIFMSLQVCNDIVCKQGDTRVGFDLLCAADCKHFVRYSIFKKRFQILE